MPTGQVLRWHLRIMMQPAAISGAVAKPNSSAPSSAPTTTSRPVRKPPSTCTAMRPRRPLQHQRLLGLGEADLPGRAGMGQRGQRAGAGAALVAGDRHMVGARLGDAGGDRADADLGHQLDRHRAPAGWRSSDRGSAAPDPRSNRCRGAAAARSARRPGSSGAPGRWSCRPCGRATGRPRRAWRPAPS